MSSYPARFASVFTFFICFSSVSDSVRRCGSCMAKIWTLAALKYLSMISSRDTSLEPSPTSVSSPLQFGVATERSAPIGSACTLAPVECGALAPASEGRGFILA